MDELTPLHLILIAAIAAVIVGPERAGRLAGRAVRWLGAYRRLSGRLTPAGLAQAAYEALVAPERAQPPDPGPPGPH